MIFFKGFNKDRYRGRPNNSHYPEAGDLSCVLGYLIALFIQVYNWY